MDDNLVEYQQMLKAADAQMAKEIEDMSNGKYVNFYHNILNKFQKKFVNGFLICLCFQGTFQERI